MYSSLHLVAHHVTHKNAKKEAKVFILQYDIEWDNKPLDKTVLSNLENTGVKKV